MSMRKISKMPIKRSYSRDEPPTRCVPDSTVAQKRRRVNRLFRSSPSRCHLEHMPAEILQQIFFAALNGNLLRASPRIAAKLSNQAVYRTAFFIAFYHQNLVELRTLYKYLLPGITTLIPYWELRSMVKVVLDSKWCTWGWFKTLYLELLKDAVSRFRQIATKDIRAQDVIRGIEDDSMPWYSIAGYALHGSDQNDLFIELDCNAFNIRLVTSPAASIESNYDENGYEWEDTVHWQLCLRAFGTIPMSLGSKRGDLSDDRPFRANFNEIFGLHSAYGSGFPDDLWACLEGRILRAVQANDTVELLRTLQIDYFFYPEDIPYKISPRLFRTAAKRDVSDRDDDPALSALAVLFELDPYSLPCQSKALREWAIDTALHLCECVNDRTKSYAYMRRIQAGPNALCAQAARAFVKDERLAAYMQAKGRDIIRYMKDGVVNEPKNMLSPAFNIPVLDNDLDTYMNEAEAVFHSTRKSRTHYLSMTASQLREELRRRGVHPPSVGTRKAHYADRLMLEDESGNIHALSYFGGGQHADEDLESLVAFARSLHIDARNAASASPGSYESRGSAYIDAMDTDEEDSDWDVDSDDGDIDSEEVYSRDLDYVATFAEYRPICHLLDRKEDYTWFKEV